MKKSPESGRRRRRRAEGLLFEHVHRDRNLILKSPPSTFHFCSASRIPRPTQKKVLMIQQCSIECMLMDSGGQLIKSGRDAAEDTRQGPEQRKNGGWGFISNALPLFSAFSWILMDPVALVDCSVLEIFRWSRLGISLLMVMKWGWTVLQSNSEKTSMGVRRDKRGI